MSITKIVYRLRHDLVLTAAHGIRQCDPSSVELEQVEVPREYISLPRWAPCRRKLIY